MQVPIAYVSFPRDESQLQKMPQVACICGAFYENVCKKRDNGIFDESNKLNSPWKIEKKKVK